MMRRPVTFVGACALIVGLGACGAGDGEALSSSTTTGAPRMDPHVLTQVLRPLAVTTTRTPGQDGIETDFTAACFDGEALDGARDAIERVLRSAGASDVGRPDAGDWWTIQMRLGDRMIRVGTYEDFLARARIGEGAAPSTLRESIGEHPGCDAFVVSNEP